MASTPEIGLVDDTRATSEAPFEPKNPNLYSGSDTIVQGPNGPVQGDVDLEQQRAAYRAARILGQAVTDEDK